jgi:hypothetical protein
MRESRTYGSVRGARGNSRPYRVDVLCCAAYVAVWHKAAVCRGATSGRVLEMLRTLGALWPDDMAPLPEFATSRSTRVSAATIGDDVTLVPASSSLKRRGQLDRRDDRRIRTLLNGCNFFLR